MSSEPSGAKEPAVDPSAEQPFRVLIAPDSFKGSIAAAEAAAAIGIGWRSVRPRDQVALAPMADGGEGTSETLESAVPSATRHPVRVIGPDDEEVDTWWLQLPDGTALVELASTSGLGLLRDGLRPHTAHTYGFGQAIAAALDAGATGLLLAVGGSSSTDGGAGALMALGARLLDAEGGLIALGNRGLHDVAAADLSGLRPLPRAGVDVLVDVDNPLLGDEGAAAVYGPQKGAGPGDVPVLDANLARFEALISANAAVAGAGAAGGTAFGLLAWGARLTPGASAIGAALGLPQEAARSSLVITGEGRFDAQSAHGKVAAHVAAIARSARVPAALIAGSIEADPRHFARAFSLSDLAGGSRLAMDDPKRWLKKAAAQLAHEWTASNRQRASHEETSR